ncbi:D-arabinono-1,4-lactone oxidase [Solicola sp. PLA-1-18]|uniref:D-arabinono-1,4-lactone oxidase n=1 Tax=Solicola sp. PLA-1-18 TaxID=3380532 RepID=UPI003B82B6CA
MLTNWAGNVTFSTDVLHRPTTVEQLQQVVADARRLRVLGSGHSFSTVADSDAALVTVRGLDLPSVVEPGGELVTVAAGRHFGEVAAELTSWGRALHNLGSLPHISLAGAVATGTHGSGDALGNLSTAVEGVELVTADGELVTLTRADDPDVFGGAVLALGSLGVMTRLTVRTQPAFDVRQDVWLDVPLETYVEQMAEVMAAGYSVSAFTDWSRPDVLEKVWVKSRVDVVGDGPAEPERWGGTLATTAQHAITGIDPSAATQQLGVPGPWNERLPHFRLAFTPSSGDEIQSEYLVPREHGPEAVRALRAVAHLFPGVLLVHEIRTVAADDLWISPTHQRDAVALHFTWTDDAARVMPVVAAVEEAIAPFSPRPHWGKVFSLDPADVAASYPRMDDLVALVRKSDPDGVFVNDFTRRHLGL